MKADREPEIALRSKTKNVCSAQALIPCGTPHFAALPDLNGLVAALQKGEHGVASRFNVRSARNSFRRPQIHPRAVGKLTSVTICRELKYSDQTIKSEHVGTPLNRQMTPRPVHLARFRRLARPRPSWLGLFIDTLGKLSLNSCCKEPRAIPCVGSKLSPGQFPVLAGAFVVAATAAACASAGGSSAVSAAGA